ncbi:MAG: hypothetical protein HC890_17310 [Chloroflexaceae bacterium]|nr:hypothetical protein [Chloroflexaceae bacterium]
MTKLSWHPQIHPALAQDNFDAVTSFYEQAVETEPEVISHYWYLGIAYLLQGREEEAQSTWLLVFMGADPAASDSLTGELAQILDTEAKRQEVQEDWQKAWLLRGHLRELAPALVNNVLQLLALEMTLEQYVPERLEEVQLKELLAQTPATLVDSELLLRVLTKSLYHPSRQAIEFIEATLHHTDRARDFILNLIMQFLAFSENTAGVSSPLMPLKSA